MGKRGVDKIVKRIISLFLIMILGIDSFGQYVPAGMGTVYATEKETDYENGSEEAEEVIRAAEKAAGIEVEETESAKENEEETKQNSVSLQNSDPNADYEWKDFSVNGNVLEGDYANNDAIRLSSDLLIKGSLSINNSIDLNGHTLTVEGNITQYKDFVIDGQCNVYGNYQCVDGDITFENGYMRIAGDFKTESSCDIQLTMEHAQDYLLVEGDITLIHYNKLTTNITDGTIELKGDFTQEVMLAGQNILYPETDFLAEGNSMLLLSGEDMQNIYIAKETSGFGNIKVKTEGLPTDDEGNYLFGNRIIGFSGQCNYDKYEDYGCPTTYGYAILNPEKMDESIIYGSCYFEGEPWHLNNRLTVIGDFIQAGDLYLEKGALFVYGDYRIQSIGENGEYGETEAKLVSQNYSTNYIYGDFVTQSVTDHTGLLTNGIWYLYGNLYQYGKSAKNFVTSDNMYIYLDSITSVEKREFHIVMDNPIDNIISHLRRYASNIDIVIDNGACILESYLLGSYTGYIIVKGELSYADYAGDVKIMSDTNILSSLYVDGNLYIEADVSVTNSLQVEKDIIVERGVLTVNNAKISAESIYFQDGSDSALVMEMQYGSVYCKDFYYGSNRKSGNLTNGNIQFTGKFDVRDTGTPDSFVCSGEHMVTATGNSKDLEINIDNPESNIETLRISSSEDVRITEQTVIHNLIYAGPYHVWEGTEGYVLEQDEVYDEDFILSDGTLDLNGHTLTINGDFNAGQGKIYIHGGKLVVNGNLNLVYRNWCNGSPEYMNSKAEIIMNYLNDRIDVAGDLYANLSSGGLKYMDKGSIHISGNVRFEGVIGKDSRYCDTVMNGVSLYFEGEKEHAITAANDHIILDVGNFMASDAQKIQSEITVSVNGILQLPEQYQFPELQIQNLNDIQGNTIKGNIVAKTAILKKDIYVDGDLNISKESDLCGYKIYAEKMTVDGELYLSGGAVCVKELYMNNKIYMQEAEDMINTTNMYVNLRTKDSDYMTDGIILVTGNFTDSTENINAFLPSGNHTFIFSAPMEKKAVLTFNNTETMLNRAVFKNDIANYTINREKSEIARDVIFSKEDTEKPEKPEPVKILKNNVYYVELQWEKEEENTEIAYYILYRDDVSLGKFYKGYYLDLGLLPHTTYHYAVSAVDWTGNESEKSEECVVNTYSDNKVPKYSKAPKITGESGKVNIDCTGTFEDGESYIDYYILEKDGSEIARLTESVTLSCYPYGSREKITKKIREGNPTYTEEGLEYGKLYTYCLYAVDAGGNKSKGYTIKVAGNYKPPIPTGFYAESKNGYNIIYFNKSGDGECSSYILYRNGEVISQFSNDKRGSFYYIDKEVNLGDDYTYYMQSENMYKLKGEPTQECEVTTVGEEIDPVIDNIQANIPGNIINENLELQITASDNGGIKHMQIYLVQQGETEKKQIVTNTPDTVKLSETMQYTLNTYKLKGTYDLHIIVTDYCGNKTEEILTYKINIAGLPPVELIQKKSGTTSVSLAWKQVEGADYYLIEWNIKGGKQLYRTSNTSYKISNLHYNMEYYFRVIAYDKNGVRGLSSEEMLISTSPDTTGPVITEIYEDNSVIATNTDLTIGYSDDTGVEKVRAYYRKSGETEWSLIREITVKKNTGKVTMSWEKDGLNSGIYEVRYEAEDYSGNVSEEVIGTYQLDLDGPKIRNLTLTPGDWKVRLDWDAFQDADYNIYKLQYIPAEQYDEAPEEKRSHLNMILLNSGKDNTSYEFMVSPQQEYVYILYAYDVYGNVSTAVVRGKSNDNDIYPPEINPLPALSVAQDIEFYLSAPICTDNNGIASYEWNMGNGDIVQGEKCTYTYHKAGTYEVTLTVTDFNGNSSSRKTTITVMKNVGIVDVTVVSGKEKLSEAAVVANINGNPCYSSEGNATNNQGMLSFSMAAGTYRFAAYKKDYLPAEVEVTVEPGKRQAVTINLEKGEIVTAQFQTHEMTKQQMEDAGIDTSSNKKVYEYQVKLKYGKDNVDMLEFNSEENHVEYTVPTYNGSGSSSGSSGSTGSNTKITVDNVSDDPSKPIFIITKTVSVSISWLKNIYQIDVTINNESGEGFDLEESEAVLNLPEGLDFAEMQSDKSQKKWKIGTIKGGESKTHTWYVSGSRSGSYQLKLNFNGVLQPFQTYISKVLISAERLEVKVGDGLHLYIYPEDKAYIGEAYYVQFKLANESEEDYHYVTTNFPPFESTTSSTSIKVIRDVDGIETNTTISTDTGINYYLSDKAKKNANVILCSKDNMTVETLKAGESIYGTYKFWFSGAGDASTEYYKLLDDYAETVNSNGTDVKVTIKPITAHLTKKIIKFNSKRRNNANSSNTAGNNQNSNSAPYRPSPHPAPPTHDSTQTVKDPVNLMTGAFMADHVVAAVAGADRLDFALSYNSLYTEKAGDLGKGWYHNYEKRIEQKGSLLAFYQNPSEVIYFSESEDTANVVCGTVEDNTVLLEDDAQLERTYYQDGVEDSRYRITKNKDGYVADDGEVKYLFDLEGSLTGYVNEIGQKLVVSRSEDGLAVTDQATGKSITAFYNEEGRITSIVDAAGHKTQLSYKNDCMTTLTGKTGVKLSYEYDKQGRIVKGIEGEKTVYVENTYDEAGRVLTQTANGKEEEKTTFQYEELEDGTLSVTMTNADGTTEKAVSDRYGQGISYETAIGGKTEYSYNENGDMTAYRQPDGTGADYTYDSAGNITKVVETNGKTTVYAYDSDNRIIRMTCNDGTDIRYTYNGAGQVETVTGSNGLKASYTYNEDGQILTETSELGTINYTYEDNMLHAVTDYNGSVHTFAYDANGNVVQYEDASGTVTDYKVDVSGRVTEESVELEDGRRATVTYTYDEFGNMLTKTDAEGNTTSYVYDEEDRLIEEKRPDGKSYTYSYDVNGNITKITCPDGKTVLESVYDAAGNALSLKNTLQGVQTASYSAGNQILSMMQSNGGEIKYTYYDNGLLKSQTDANGNTTTLIYDEAGRISKVTDGAGATTTYGYDKEGNLTSVENALGNFVHLEYNQYRQVIRQTDANGNETAYAYDKAMNCIHAEDAAGGVTEFAYDGAGRIRSMTKKGNTSTQDVTMSMEYDNLGNVISVTDGEGNTRRMEYDLNSNLTAVYDAKGVKTESYVYDCLGNCIEISDAFGNVTENSYDDLGNLVKQMNKATGNAVVYSYVGGRYLSSSTDSMGSTASATYDSMGNLSTLTNPNGGVTSYKYDLNSNLTDEIIGEDYHIRYTYNAQNLAATKTNSRDQQAVYEYDALGRITKQTDEAGVIEYTYDGNDNVLTVTETTGDTVNTITRTYDGLNRVTSYEDAKGNKIKYEYDKLGNLVLLTYPDGREVHYTYDKNSNVKTVTDWEGRVTTYTYDVNGRLVKTERANKTVETRTYDKAGRLIRILDKCGDTTVNQQDYTYDAAGNITEVKHLYEGKLDFTGVTSAKMTYDKNNRLLTYNGEKIEYDKDGNMTYGPLQGKMTRFEFDCRNRLIKAGDTTYAYDAENNRTAVTTGTTRTEYVVNTQPELSQVLQSTTINGSRKEVTYYFYGKGLIAQDSEESGYLTYHFNNVGSTMAVTDESGTVKYAYQYSPYGELLEGEYSDTIPFLYNGQYGVTTDANGLYYMRARYYNVDIKRFINQDVLMGTLERISSLNRYAYVEGNPVSYLDPFGLAKSIYDDAYDWLQMAENLSLGINTAFDLLGLGMIKGGFEMGELGTVFLIIEIIPLVAVYGAELGVAIGRAWEGILENDYAKVDSSYEMMGEVTKEFLNTLSTIALDQITDTPVYGLLSDLITIAKKFSDKYIGG